MSDIESLEKMLVSRLHLVKGDIETGPVVERHYFQVQSGVRFSALQSATSKCGFYIDWCRGENDDCIAVEVPRATRDQISLSGLLSSPEFQDATGTLSMILGTSSLGQPIVADLVDMPHMLIAGDKGTGKTTLLKSIVSSIIARTTPDKCKFMILEPRDSGLGSAVAHAHLAWAPITGDSDAALAGLRVVVAEMERRYNVLSATHARDIAAYTGADMPRLVVIVDDLADLMAESRGKSERHLIQIAQKGRSVGVHIIAATGQAKNLSGILKANFSTRMSFHVESAARSRQTLGEVGAELLLPYGDALFSDAGRIPVRIHTPSV